MSNALIVRRGGKKGTELMLVVTVNSGSVVTATKDEQVISGTAINDLCILVIPEAGEWTVFATYDGRTSDAKTINIIDNYELSLSFVSPILNNNDWSTIRAIGDAGEGANYWSIGDCKADILNGTLGKLSLNNYTAYAFIIGFDHNESREGTNRIHMQFGKTDSNNGIDIAFCDDLYGNSVSAAIGYFSANQYNSNVGGWKESQLRNVHCGTDLTDYPDNSILAVISDELRSVLLPVTKYSDNVGNKSKASSSITETTEYFFCLSLYEVFGSTTRANPYEYKYQKQYEYYLAGNSTIKYKHDELNVAIAWYLRTPDTDTTSNFHVSSTGGVASFSGAYFSRGFAPAFCL